MRIAAMVRFLAIVSLAAFAMYAAYINAHDESTVSVVHVRRATIGWSVLPVLILGIYALNAALARDSAKSFIPSICLMIAYSIVFGYFAWNGPSNALRAGSTHLIFIPLILGVITLPFFVFMADRAFNLARGRK